MGWGVLRTALSSRIKVTKVIALVFALSRLHTFCLDERERRTTLGEELLAPPLLDIDEQNILNDDNGYVAMDEDSNQEHSIPIPTALMDAGHHFDDVPRSICRPRRKDEDELPQKILHDKVCTLHARRPIR